MLSIACKFSFRRIFRKKTDLKIIVYFEGFSGSIVDVGGFDFWACLTFECRRFRKAEEGEEEVRLPSVAQTALLWGEWDLDGMGKWGGLMVLIYSAYSKF